MGVHLHNILMCDAAAKLQSSSRCPVIIILWLISVFCSLPVIRRCTKFLKKKKKLAFTCWYLSVSPILCPHTPDKILVLPTESVEPFPAIWKAITHWKGTSLEGTSSPNMQCSGFLCCWFLFSCGLQECSSYNDGKPTTNKSLLPCKRSLWPQPVCAFCILAIENKELALRGEMR